MNYTSGCAVFHIMDNPRPLPITLQPDGVAAAGQRISVLAANAVGTSLSALDAHDCGEPEGWGQNIGYKFPSLELDSDERKRTFKNWVLAKGFQDLARSVRAVLEEALFFIEVAKWESPFKTTWAEFQDRVTSLRADVAKLKFPQLLERVNADLREPIPFYDEFLSLQNVRNCLEHRGGRVEPKDVDPDSGRLSLTFPRFKIFYMRGAEEVELRPGEVIDTHAEDHPFEKGQVEILLRQERRVREFELNEAVVISAEDFFEIAMACQIFASEVARRLPSVGNASVASET